MHFFCLWVNCATYCMFISLHICCNTYVIYFKLKNFKVIWPAKEHFSFKLSAPGLDHCYPKNFWCAFVDGINAVLILITIFDTNNIYSLNIQELTIVIQVGIRPFCWDTNISFEALFLSGSFVLIFFSVLRKVSLLITLQFFGLYRVI